jgi:hypothetical protein
MGDMDWIDLAQNSDRFRAVVNTAMKLCVPKMRGISSLSEDLLTPEQRR